MWRSRLFGLLTFDLSINRTGIPGLYSLATPFPCPFLLLVIEDMEVREEFFPLLLMAPREKLRATIKEMARERERLDPSLQKYINRVYYLQYDEVKDMTELDSLIDEKSRNIPIPSIIIIIKTISIMLVCPFLLLIETPP